MASDTLSSAPAAPTLRQRLFTGLAGVIVLGAVAYGSWWLLVGSHHVETDDAYVGADVAQITPQTAGAVRRVLVGDTQVVHAGDVLVELDPADAAYPLAQAKADYARVIRRVKGEIATTEAALGTVSARDADLARARAQLVAASSDLARAKLDADRREKLAASGAVSGEELTNARTLLRNAEANLAAVKAAEALAEANLKVARAQSQAQAALTADAGVEDNPEVKFARANLEAAQMNYDRTVLRAPVDGVVAKRNVQVGQRVAIGAPLMSIVPINQAYVDANFKEVQLKQVRIGQSVEVKADLYGGGVTFHGTVVGVGGGTGAAFAMIPAQNATGNWIKVVQRLPVRIRLDPKQLAEHPLRVGLSVKADIDTASNSGSNSGSSASK
jgi:membrane fusion protein (multidrug efflux system)